jgi:hypothetical protein
MTPRKPHLLNPLDKITRPTRVIFVDTETTRSILPNEVEYHTLRLGYALHCKSNQDEYLRVQSDKVINDCLDFWGWVDELCYDKSALYMVAHNWHFDSTVLNAFEYLPAYHFELVQWYAKAQTFIMHWKREGCHLTMIDNGNLFTGKLEALGKTLGYEKGSVDFDTVEDNELLTYCKRDVEIMRLAWIKWLQFLDEHDCGDFRYTVASQALETFRFRFMKQYIFIHADEPSIALERQSYHGGRVEAKFVGHKENDTFTYLDVNNMYGHVMSKYEYPSGFYHHEQGGNTNRLEYLLDNCSVIAEVELQTTQNPFPCIHQDKLIYPTGHYTATLCTPELKYAIDRDWIVKVNQLSYYPQRFLFKEYIEYFYSARQKYRADNDDMFALICKLFNNSLYGKFGSKQTIQRRVGDCPIDAVGIIDLKYPDLKQQFDLVYLGGGIFEVDRDGEGYNSFCAIAAHVTAYARMHLWELISIIPPGHYYYSDTDSVIVDEVGKSALQAYLNNDALGMLKTEISSPWLTINAPKDYAMEGRNRIKGISSNAIEIAPNTYQQQRWPKLASRIRSENLSDYQIYPQVKHLKHEINWGVPSTSGWVSPFHLD